MILRKLAALITGKVLPTEQEAAEVLVRHVAAEHALMDLLGPPQDPREDLEALVVGCMDSERQFVAQAQRAEHSARAAQAREERHAAAANRRAKRRRKRLRRALALQRIRVVSQRALSRATGKPTPGYRLKLDLCGLDACTRRGRHTWHYDGHGEPVRGAS